MLINRLELRTQNLPAQRDYYHTLLELPVELHENNLKIQAGKTELVFTQAPVNWMGAYHFCFNIPENQFAQSKAWISARMPLLTDSSGKDEFNSESWNSHSLYFKDAAGNILEFIARHDQINANNSPFDSKQIINISEIGLPSQDVISFAKELSEKLKVSIYRQEPDDTFTPVGDEDGLFILPIENRIWYPNTGVPAKLLEVKINFEVNGKAFELSGPPYVVTS